MNEEDFKNTELKDLRSGLSVSGKIRASLLLGPRNGKVAESIAELGTAIQQNNPESFWITIDSVKSGTPYDWCSQFARNLRTSNGVTLTELAKFALNAGKSLSPFKSNAKQDDGPEEDQKKIPDELISQFEALTKTSTTTKGIPHLVLAITNLSDYSDEMLSWLSDCLNPVIRKSKAFKGCRFVFTSEQISDRINTFFDSFGFEKIHMVEVESAEEKKRIDIDNPSSSLASKQVATRPSTQGETLKESQKSLKKSALPNRLNGLKDIELMDLQDAQKALSSFKDVEKEYLFLASYPARVSKYSLEHFESARNAALAYNWLKRTKSLYSLHESGDLLLNEDLRIAARTLHACQAPEVSEKWATLASVLDTFHDCFPNDESHWVPINLQLLESFDKKTLNQLFPDDDQSKVLLDFINQHEEQMVEKGERMALSDEAKIIIRRYLELSNRETIVGLSDRIRDLWLKDKDHYKVQKAKMLEERENISSEIQNTLNQVTSLKELKDGLTEDFRNPKRNKPEKAYSFSSSRALIVIGLGTIGISLFAESVGSYHAACGLALTLFGFFWPIVETKRPALATGGPRSNLAIETQHRSLNHRVGSLSNRMQVMKTNLDTVEKKLSKLGDEPPLPYLDPEVGSST